MQGADENLEAHAEHEEGNPRATVWLVFCMLALMTGFVLGRAAPYLGY